MIDTAERLFMEKGYEHTAISDIVKELNIEELFTTTFALRRDIGSSCGEEHYCPGANVIQLVQDDGIDEATRLNAAINGILGFVSQRSDLLTFCIRT